MKTQRTPRRSSAPQCELLEGRTLLSFGYGGVTTLGGSTGSGQAMDIAMEAGNRYVTGSFRGMVDFDPANVHPGDTDIISSRIHTLPSGYSYPEDDIFVAKYAADGKLVWVRSMGGNAGALDSGEAIAVDGAGQVYVCGRFWDTADFGNGIFLPAVGQDDFVAKLDADGNTLWVRSRSEAGNEVAGDLAVDSAGNVVTAIDTAQVKYDSSGNMVWTKILQAGARSVAIDASNRVYFTGGVDGKADLDPGPGKFIVSSKRFAIDGYLVVLDANGSFVRGLDFEGGPGNAIALDVAGNAYIAGSLYATKISPGNKILWKTSVARGSGIDRACAVAVDSAGAVYVTGGRDVQKPFIWKLNGSNGQFLESITLGTGGGQGRGLAIDSTTGAVFIVGWYSETIDFDPTNGTDERNSSTDGSIFFWKLTQS